MIMRKIDRVVEGLNILGKYDSFNEVPAGQQIPEIMPQIYKCQEQEIENTVVG